MPVRANQVIGTSDLGRLRFTPVANAHGTGYASFTFKVSDGVSESAANTMTMDVTAVNDPATGLPTITGTAREGQTLTAEASAIADVDGLPAVSAFAWQWLRVNGGTEVEIQGATSKTYRVVAADAGAKFKVRVSFTDLDGNAEALTSAAYPVDTSAVENALPTSADRTVTTDEDTSYPFGPVDFAFADTDSDDVLASVKLVTVPAAGSLALGGVPVRANQVIGISDLGRLRFTPVANAHGTGYASFTFKVSDGVSESAVANTMTMDVTAVNDPATGLPTITGTAREGQTLTAEASAIADVDGLPAVSAFAWQWLRVSGGSDTEIQGAESKTYRVVVADAGAKFKVRVSFTDLDRNAEALTSAAYPVDTSAVENALPTSADRTVTMDEDTSYPFGPVDFAFADTDSDDVLASVKLVTVPAAGSLALGGVPVRANQVIGISDLGRLRFTPVANAHGTGYASFTFKVSDGVSESAAANTMTMDVTAVNDPATGLPTITGTAREGQTLTAEASAIADVDGLPAVSAFAWQWLRVSGGSDTEIQGAESKTYRVVVADAGAKFKVRVSFTDLDGNAEALTSAAYPVDTSAVENALPTSADRTVTMDEDTSYPFGPVDFAFTDTDSDDVLASVKLVTVPAAGSLALGGVPVRANQVIGTSDLGRLRFTPAANAHGTGYASFTFKVSDGVSESAVANTMTMDVTAVNDPATGLPTITGTAREGQTLTAEASAIADVDGLPAVSAFAWQWLRVSGGSDTEIQGATSKTYRVVVADAGAKFKVRVSFTDLDGNAEALTSAAYPVDTSAVENALPTSADRTVTTDEDTAYPFGPVDFAFTDTDSDDVLASVKLVTLPAVGTLALGGVPVRANQVIGTSDLGRLRFTPRGERARDGLCLVHVQGERRGVGERVGQHDDDGRDGGERSGERAGDHGDGSGGADADGGHVEHRGCGRSDESELPLPVDAGGRRKRDGSRHGTDACGDVGGPGQEAEGGGDADGRRRQHGDLGG